MMSLLPSASHVAKLSSLFILITWMPVQAEPPVRVDDSGDPLPAGARARLGTLRWHAGRVNWLKYDKDSQSIFTTFVTEPNTTVFGTAQNEIRQWNLRDGKELRRYRVPSENDLLHIVDVNLPRRLVAFYKRGAFVIGDMEKDKSISSIEARQHEFFDVTFSPSGKLVAGWHREQASVYLWSVENGQLRQRLRSGLERDKSGRYFDRRALIFSPDETRVLMLLGSDNLRMWDIDGKEILNHKEKDGLIDGTAFSPDGRLLAWSTDKHIHLWDVSNNRELRQLTDEEGKYDHIAFSPDGKTLASGGEQPRLWNVADGKLLRRFTCPPPCSLWEITFSPDGKELAGIDGTVIRRWNVTNGKEQAKIALPTQETSNLFFLSGDEKLATSHPRGMSLWDTRSGKYLGLDPESRSNLALAADGRLGAFSAKDRETIVCRDFLERRNVQKLKHDKRVIFHAVSSDGSTVLTVTKDERAHLWSTATAKEQRSFALPRDETIIHGRILPNMADFESKYVVSLDGRYAAYSSWSREIFPNTWRTPHAELALWELSSGKRLPNMRIEMPEATLAASAFSWDGRTLAVAVTRAMDVWEVQTWPKTFILFETATGQERARITGTTEGYMGSGFAATDGRYLAFAEGIGYERYPLFVWDAVLNRSVGSFHPTHNVRCLAFSHDGQTLATGLGDGTVLLWDMPKPAREEPKLSAKDQEEAWSALTGADARKAYRAIHRLAAAPRQSIPFLRDRLKPVAAVDAKRLERLIADLDSDSFAVREKASGELRQMGSLIESVLRSSLKKNPPLEVRRRIQQLLEPLNRRTLSPDELRCVRTVEAVEHMAAPEARQLLTQWAEGDPDAFLTREARLALHHLGHK